MESNRKEVPEIRMDLDAILAEAGQLGRYQLRVFAVLALGVVLIGWSNSEYIFTAARIKTRCLISECETASDSVEFSPWWLANAVPSTDSGTLDSCRQYAVNSSASVAGANETTCPAALFDPTTTASCHQYVYQNEYTIVHEFELACDEWRRTLIGSLRAVGTMLGYPLCGYASDRWGRRVALAAGAILTTMFGLLRCLANSYSTFVAAQVLETFLGGGAYSCAFVLLLEMLVAKWRMMASSLSGTLFSVGQASCALLAWAVPHWRQLTLTVYLPQLLTFTYLWIVPESTRWLLSNGRVDDAVDGLRNVARVNGIPLSEKSLAALRDCVEYDKNRKVKEKMPPKQEWLHVQVLRNKQLLFRCMVVPVWWVAFVFVFYGLSVNAVTISGDPHLNFMVVTMVEIPGFWMSCLLVTTIGRKPPLVGGFLVCAACQLAYLFIPQESYGASLAVYLIGKCCIAMVAIGTYTYTAELFPTECRHRLLAYCSMVGRIGAVLAPLTPAFGSRLPFILFASLSLLAGLSVLLTPETRGVPLPDTVRDMDTSETRGVPLPDTVRDMATSETRGVPLSDTVRDMATYETRGVPLPDTVRDMATSEIRGVPLPDTVRYMATSETRGVPLSDTVRDMATSETRGVPLPDTVRDMATSETRGVPLPDTERDMATSETRGVPLSDTVRDMATSEPRGVPLPDTVRDMATSEIRGVSLPDTVRDMATSKTRGVPLPDTVRDMATFA